MNRKYLGVLLALVLLATATAAQAQIPRRINFQGRLGDASGNAKTGSFSITFSIWTTLSGGTAPCFSETHPVPVNSGLFSVNIGDRTTGGISTSCTFDVPSYVQVQVYGDIAMTPRLPLAAAPYAIRAQMASDADAVGGLTATQHYAKAEYTVHSSCAGAGSLSCNAGCVTYVYGAWRYGGCWDGDTAYDYRPGACPAGCQEMGNPSYACDTALPLYDYWGWKYRYKKTCLCSNTLHGYIK